jgi:hypothetical protein
MSNPRPDSGIRSNFRRISGFHAAHKCDSTELVPHHDFAINWVALDCASMDFMLFTGFMGHGQGQLHRHDLSIRGLIVDSRSAKISALRCRTQFGYPGRRLLYKATGFTE